MIDYDKIKVLEGLEGIQHKPGMYIGDTSSHEGYHNMLWEVVYNSLDEHVAGFGNLIDITYLNGNFLVKDNGRGIPFKFDSETGKSYLELALTKVHAGGKFDENNYDRSIGTHGVGLTVVNALSEYLFCIVQRGLEGKAILFKFGEKILERDFTSSESRSYTYMFFKPSMKFFSIGPDLSLINNQLHSLAFLFPNLKVRLRWDNLNFVFKEIGGMLSMLNSFKGERLLENPFKLNYSGKNGNLEVYFDWRSKQEKIRAFTNGLEQASGGTHVNSFLKELKRTFFKLLKKDMSVSELREGLQVVMHLQISNPSFSSQTKERLVSAVAQDVLKEAFETEEATQIMPRRTELLKVYKWLLRVNSYKRELDESKLNLTRSNLNGMPYKLMPCRSRDITKNELIITEGDSAGATAKMARDSEFQSVFPVQGKVLNVERATFRKVTNFKEIRDLIKSLGTNLGRSFDISGLTHGKIIIAADGDEDGYHISGLLVSLFYKYCRPLIENKHVYVTYPPLFKLTFHGREYFFRDRAKMERFLIKKQGLDPELLQSYYKVAGQIKDDFLSILDNLMRNDWVKYEKDNNLFYPIFYLKNSHVLGNIFYGFSSSRERLQVTSEILISMYRLRYYGVTLTQVHDILDLSKYKLYRFKGLGQMNPDQLWHHVLNPATRELSHISLREPVQSQVDYQRMMGKDPRWRKQIIVESIVSPYELDV